MGIMSQVEKSNEYYQYEEKCQSLLKEPEIRFAALINHMGNLVAGGDEARHEAIRG